MEYTLPWGNSSLTFELPEEWEVIDPVALEEGTKDSRDEQQILADSLRSPIGCTPLSSWDLKGKRVLLVVDDNTRPTPVHKFLHLILDELETAGASGKEILLMPALGIHTHMSQQEMVEKAGEENLSRIVWRNHDSFSDEEQVFFGRTSRGTQIYLNKEVERADAIVLVGMIEPHLWAGFGGGLKNLFPGLGSADSIGHHHGIIAEPPYPYNRVGQDPEENYFRKDLEEVKELLHKPVFCVNVLLEEKGKIMASVSGDPVQAHRRGANISRRHCGRLIPEKVDGLIVNSHPMDLNLKQSMKGVANTLPALKPGGLIMAFLKAERGLDDIVLPDKSLPLWLSRSILRILGPSRVMWFLEKVKKDLKPEEKFLVYYNMQLIREHELLAYVPSLSEEEVRALGFFQSCSRPSELISKGRRRLGRGAKVAIFSEAGATFPVIGSV